LFDYEMLRTMNVFHKIVFVTGVPVYRCWAVSEIQFLAEDRKSGNHHDNAVADSSQLVRRFLDKHSNPQVRQSSYSSDMAPCNFFLFSEFKKKPLRGTWYDRKEISRNNATEQLLAIQKKLGRIWGSHGGEYEDGCLLGCSAV
jgi:hypothetical protein